MCVLCNILLNIIKLHQSVVVGHSLISCTRQLHKYASHSPSAVEDQTNTDIKIT